MADETQEQVHSTSQEVEPTQTDVTDQQSDQSTDETVIDNDASEPGEEKTGGKDPNEWAIKRIGALTAKSHQAEREAQAAKGEAERYRLLVEQMRNGENPPAESKPGQEPNIDELVTKRATELEQQRTMVERGQNVAKVGAEAYPDFTTAVSTLDALGISDDQVQSLLGMDDAHNVIYKLGKNPEEAARILALPPLQQGRELERLSSKPAPAAPAKPVSKAPAPISPIDSNARAEADPSKMSMDDWVKWREKTSKTRF